MSKNTAPSAPPEESVLESGAPPYPRIEHNEVQNMANRASMPPSSDIGFRPSQPHSSGTANSSSEGTPQQPPPSYQDAVNYPPAYQPNIFPKPQTTEGGQVGQDFQYPPYPTHYNAAMPGSGASPATNNYVIHHHPPLPQPPTTTTITVVPTGNCVHCLTGVVHNETDVCCLLCLIILAICTFPFGLVALCCIPCTVRRRCSRCRLLNP